MIKAKGEIVGNVSTKQRLGGIVSSGMTYVLPDNMVTNELVTVLPEPSEEYRGHFRMIESGGTDTIYVCLKINGIFSWTVLGNVDDNSSPALGKAMLDKMILG